MTLKITRAVVSGLIEHAREEAPRECCGLLVGRGEVVDEYRRTLNLRASAVAYEIDPGEHIAIRKELRTRSKEVLGAYHSHPRSAAVPSATDIAEAHYDREFIYLIVSLGQEPPDLRAYRRTGGTLVEEPLEPVS